MALRGKPGSQFVTLYRGLAGTTPEEVTKRDLGPHWTVDPEIAYNFATSRDVWGTHHHDAWDDEDAPHGTVIRAKVHKRHIIDPESEEGKDWMAGENVLGPENIEQERTVRPGAIVHVEEMGHYTDDKERLVKPQTRRGWRA